MVWHQNTTGEIYLIACTWQWPSSPPYSGFGPDMFWKPKRKLYHGSFTKFNLLPCASHECLHGIFIYHSQLLLLIGNVGYVSTIQLCVKFLGRMKFTSLWYLALLPLYHKNVAAISYGTLSCYQNANKCISCSGVFSIFTTSKPGAYLCCKLVPYFCESHVAYQSKTSDFAPNYLE